MFVVEPPRYVLPSRDYRPAPYKLVRYENAIPRGMGAGRTAPPVATLCAVLGLRSDRHLSARVGEPAPAGTRPLARRQGRSLEVPVEIVRTYGRGYVVPDVTLRLDGERCTGGLAVKGAGEEAWAAANKRWVVQENHKRGVLLGAVRLENFVGDLVGEAWALRAGLVGPATVSCVRRSCGFQVCRFWRCPYRLWELSSGPFRLGPHVSQAAVQLNWGIELAFAVAFRDAVRARVRTCLADVHGSADAASWIAAVESVTLENVAKAAGHGLQLAAFVFHLANISYSGETSGYDRILGPATDPAAFVLGVVGATLDVWAAQSWLRAVVGFGPESYAGFFDRFRERLVTLSPEADIVRPFSHGATAVSVLAGVRLGRRPPPLDLMMFSVRGNGDVTRYVAAAETFFEGLRLVYTGELANLSQLQTWQESVRFDELRRARMVQMMCGDVQGPRCALWSTRVRHQRMLERMYRRALTAAGRG